MSLQKINIHKKVKGNGMEAIGHYVFLAGVLLAIILGLFSFEPQVKAIIAIVLIVAGLIVGFVNITATETIPFLIAAIALIVSSGFAGALFGAVPQIGGMIQSVFVYILIFVSPAALVVALKTIYSLAKNK